MSKKKKTLDELLDEALVTEEEQPYEIPNNWEWLRLEMVSDYIQRGKSPKYVENSNAIVVSQKCVQWSGFDISVARNIDEATLEKYTEERFLKKLDLLWNSTGTGTIGRVAIIEDELKNPTVADSHVTVVRANQKLVFPKYLYYWLSSPFIQNKLENSYSGSTNQIELNLSAVKKEVIILPPLEEQKRITDKIEILFAKVDKAQKLIEESKHQLLLNRKAVMKEKLFGEMDITNLKHNSDIYGEDNLAEGWKWIKINDLLIDSKKSMTTGPFGTALKKTDYRESGVPVLGIDNIDKGRFIKTNKVFITKEKALDLNAFSVNENDVIISRSGTVGELCVVPKTAIPSIISTNIIKLTLNTDVILPEFFVAMFLNDGIVKDQVKELCKGSTREFLNQTILKSIYFPVPSLDKQRYIIEEINKYSLLVDKIQRELLINTDQLKQSILTKAFKGELGTNDPIDEPAIELLKSILKEKL
ncbi:restriction endonuclease subunit S [Paenibacillus sp. FSL P2-0322]|uniref:Restriction endonuclease subunit S n=1 Tax=Paenibacillus polymyxa TaxID=1406 RepID=A0AAP4EBF9_PAEPO|nr:restriction endonuclease subunit S [Paenibacillus polymyxa]MDH2331924.1 restriction endonuclease subunit S [Paenibacillus polymyxa]